MIARLFSLILILHAVCGVEAAEPVDFERDVAPILQQHCIRCHSPNNKKGDVSLATVADLQANGYIEAHEPDASYLIDLVVSEDNEPPEMPKESEPLSEQEVSVLRSWIDQGAKWPADVVVHEKSKADTSFWSLQPVADVAPPDVKTLPKSWAENPIDRFVYAQLNENDLSSSPRAGRRALIRRLSFDLHGMPPTPEQVDTFVNDTAADAYEQLVDAMLDSPHYGERFARHWLDIAHYADTHGFERDKRRDNAWRYRDYVIDAFNSDKPYDRFLQEQIAGDVLWPDDSEAVIATGFLAAGPWDFVGQVETKSPMLRRAARSLDLDDMATQVMTCTMGITINCARCHDHKLDPISQKEYYQLRAVFAGVERKDRVVSNQALKEYEARKQQLEQELNQIDFEIGRLEGEGIDLADIVGGGNGLGTGTYRQGIDARTAKVQTRDFGKLGNVVTNQFVASDFEFVDGVFIPNGANEPSVQVSSTGIEVTGLPATSGDAWDMIRNGPVASQHSPELGGIDFTKDGHSLLGIHANAGITFDLKKIRDATSLGKLRFVAQLGYFGAGGSFQAGAWVYVDGEQVAGFEKLKRQDGLQPLDLELDESKQFLTLIATDGGNGFSHDQVGFGDAKLKPVVARELSNDEQQRLVKLQAEKDAISQKLKALGAPPNFYGVVAQKEVPAVQVLLRGNPETPIGDELTPAAIQAVANLNPQLGSLESDEGERRAALAKWITDPDNPLTSRVIVNRLWHWHFGQGIVSTPSDFGFGGSRPSHPKLLDWLAQELMHSNWSLKEMHRLILTSQTYQQDSRYSDDSPGNQVDANNRLLWRQNPRRISAEAVRDSVLRVSGCLNLERGGPGFEDFEYTEAYAPIYAYVTADSPELWRRSIYRYIVRTTPNRFLTTLDCPDPSNLTPKRLTTTTPLQSLALYNNDFMLKQARYFAERVEKEVGDHIDAQVDRAFKLALSRQADQRESELAVQLVREQGLFLLCRSLLNSNEFVYVD